MDRLANMIEGVEGVVKWFDTRKGYGFIGGPDGLDVFAHYSVIDGGGFRALKDGSTVTFDAVYDAARGKLGWRATRVYRTPEIETGAQIGEYHQPPAAPLEGA